MGSGVSSKQTTRERSTISSSRQPEVAIRQVKTGVFWTPRRGYRKMAHLHDSNVGQDPSAYYKGTTPRYNPCIFDIGGPILFTAPHGIPLWRGGEDGKKRQKHLREFWATEITLKLARHAAKAFGIPGSFMIWDCKQARAYDSRNLDPNFLSRAQFSQSPWHHALETFASYGNDVSVPLLHVDIHGKKDRKTDLAMDIGSTGMKTFLNDTKLAHAIVKDLNGTLSSVFDSIGVVKDDLQFSVEVEPQMSGYWKGDVVFTMSSQSAMLGVPSLQLELPKTMRQRLFENDKFLAEFGDCILHVYKEVICRGKLRTPEWYRSFSRSTRDVDILLAELEKQRQVKRELKI